jgi:hypothetical protein
MSVAIAALVTAIGLAIGMTVGTRYLKGFLSDIGDDVSWVDASVHLSGSVLAGMVMGAFLGVPIWAYFDQFPINISGAVFMVIGALTVLGTSAFTGVHRFGFSVTVVWTLGAGVLAGMVAVRIGLTVAGRGLGTLGAVLGDSAYTSAYFFGGMVVGVLAGALVGVVTGTAIMLGQIAPSEGA